jgi:hypothetical protein
MHACCSILQVFETNIRIVGGLLSAFYLTGGNDTALVRLAAETADRWAAGAGGCSPDAWQRLTARTSTANCSMFFLAWSPPFCQVLVSCCT